MPRYSQLSKWLVALRCVVALTPKPPKELYFTINVWCCTMDKVLTCLYVFESSEESREKRRSQERVAIYLSQKSYPNVPPNRMTECSLIVHILPHPCPPHDIAWLRHCMGSTWQRNHFHFNSLKWYFKKSLERLNNCIFHIHNSLVTFCKSWSSNSRQ